MQHVTNTKNSNVASEGDQTLCNYKGVFLKSYRHYCRYIFFLFFGHSQNLLLELQNYEFFATLRILRKYVF